MNLRRAAKTLNVHIATVRKWIRKGCPCIEQGEVGRRGGTEVDLEQVRRWRVQQVIPSFEERSQADTLQLLTVALLDVLRRDDLAGRAHLSEAQAALVTLLVFERAYRNLKHKPLTLEYLPVAMKPFHSIVVSSMESGTFHQRR
jgi:phage terminase Nu1 subunit (DNA packaging protein)